MGHKYNYTFTKNQQLYCLICKKPYRCKPPQTGCIEHFNYYKKWLDYRINFERKPNRIKYHKDKFKEKKILVLSHYSNPIKCNCCGEKIIEFLTFHHPKNDGKSDREKRGIGGRFYYSLIRDNFPSGYEVLCWNCNCAKRYGECPHKQIKQSTS